MTLPKNVEDAVKSFDGWLDFILAEYSGHESEWQAIRAELHRLTDRLEAADALLLDIKEWDVAEASRRFSLSDNGVIFILPDVLRSRIQSHLQGAGDEA